MATYNALWSAFNDGELSPLLDGRSDIPQYMKSGRVMLNFIPTVQGPMVRRGGSYLVGQNGNGGTAPSLLIPFARSRTDAYIIEIFDGRARFFFNGSLVLNGGSVYTINVPYQNADLYNADGTPALSYAESVDQLYIAHPAYPPQILSFFGPTNWTIAPLNFFDGPWQDQNTDQDNRLFITGSYLVDNLMTITASKPTFSESDVGSLIRIHQQDLSQLKEWYPGQRTPAISPGILERSGTNTYLCKSTAHGTSPGMVDWVETGSSTLITTDGDQWDGPQDVVPNPATAGHYYGRGVQWTYQDCGYGVAQIIAFSDSQHIIAEIKRQFPSSLTNPSLASWRWEKGAWSDTVGWPRLVTFFKQRLVFAGIDRVWMSVSGDFANFADLQFGQVLTDSALTAQVLSDQLNSINWLAPQKTLLVGTTGGEFVISQQSISDPFGPTNFQIDQYSSYGGRQINAIRIQTSTLFVQENGRALREFSYVFTSDAYQSRDLSPLSEHITESGIVGMAWAKFPYYIVWCALANGDLVGFTYNPEQEVRCWHEHNLAGNAQVKCVATVPSADGSADDVYMVVQRQAPGGIPLFNIEKLMMPFDNAPGARQQDMFYVDAGLTEENTINATLTPGTGATTKGATNVTFTASAGLFLTTDVGRYIDYDWETTQTNDKGLTVPLATKGHALITQVVSTMQVQATIDLPWPSLDVIAANGWRMSVGTLTSPPSIWETGTVSLLLDGAAAPDQIYAGGPITLPWQASVIQAGLKSPAMWQSQRPEQGDPAGTAMGKPRRPSEATVRVLDTLGVQIGRNLDDLQTIETRPAGWPDDTPPPLYSGNLPNDPNTRITFGGDWDQDGGIVIYCPQPLAATICAVSATIDESQD